MIQFPLQEVSALMGIQRPDKGDITFDGLVFHELTPGWRDAPERRPRCQRGPAALAAFVSRPQAGGSNRRRVQYIEINLAG
jgi:hypothetical protein